MIDRARSGDTATTRVAPFENEEGDQKHYTIIFHIEDEKERLKIVRQFLPAAAWRAGLPRS